MQTATSCYITNRGLSSCTIFFPRYVIQGMTFERKAIIERSMCVLIFSTDFVRNISHSMNKSARYHINVHRSSCFAVFVLRILKKMEFSRHIFEKCSNSKFHENCPVGAELFQADTDRQNEANSRFSQFCEVA